MLVVITLSTPGPANAAKEFSQYIGFGDSTLDSGYWRYNNTNNDGYDALTAAAVANGNSGAYNGNGVENSIILAGKFGLSAAPVGAPGGGTNYANGASYTQTAGPYPGSVSAIQQIQNYLASVNGNANPKALYVIKSGDNDLNFGSPAPLPPTYLSDSASALAVEVAALQAAGARTIMVPNSYNSAVMAGLGGNIDPANAAAYATSVAYFSLRWADLQAAGVRFIPADIDSLFRYVVHNPTLFGFTAFSVVDTNSPAYNNPLTVPPNQSPYNSALWAHPLTAAQQQTFLFVDQVHLTTAGQTIEADYEYNLITAPSQISLVMANAVQNGLSLAATIEKQIDISMQPHGPSDPNVWASAGGEWQSIKNAQGFPSVSGIPFGGTVGADYRTPFGLVLGAAFTAAGQINAEFSTGGHFSQADEAPSLYAAYKSGSLWSNIVATYDLFQDQITRKVPLGVFVDVDNANTAGDSISLALRGGGDFKLGQVVTTGPVVGVVMQQVYLDGFTETGTSGVTALSFGNQTRDSFVSQLGWRISVDMGKWQAFEEMEWNHEYADRNNTVTTSLTSVVAPSYTMDAAPVASDWATASLGISCKLNSQTTLRGAFSTVFLNPQVESYGGELDLSVSF